MRGNFQPAGNVSLRYITAFKRDSVTTNIENELQKQSLSQDAAWSSFVLTETETIVSSNQSVQIKNKEKPNQNWPSHFHAAMFTIWNKYVYRSDIRGNLIFLEN